MKTTGDDASHCGEGALMQGLPDSRQFTHLLEVQRDLAVGLLSCVSLEECLELLLDSAMRLPWFDCGGIYLCGPEAGELRLLAQRGLSGEFVKQVSSYSADSPQAAMVHAGKPVYCMRSELPPEVAAVVAKEGLQALAVLPLHDRDGVVAALNVSSHDLPHLEHGSLLSLQSLVAQAEVAIASVRDRESRQLVERQLRMAVEGAELGSWVADFQTGRFTATPRAMKLHGLDPGLTLDVESAKLPIHPDDLDHLLECLRRAVDCGELFSCEYRTVPSAEGIRWISSKGRCFEENGAKRLYGIVRDITREKMAEASLIEARDQLEVRVAERTSELEATVARLRDQSTRLEVALEASQAGVSSWELGSGILEWDNRVRVLYGFEDDAPVSLDDLKERMHPDDRRVLFDDVEGIDSPGAGDTWNHEFRIMHPVLGERWLSRLGRVERDEHGRARRVLGICFDITERKLIDQTLRESEEKYRRLYESMQDAFASVDLEGRLVDFNKAFEHMLGYTREELLEMDISCFTPEKWLAMESRILADQTMIRGYSDLYEKEYRRKDGLVFPVELRTFLRKDDCGNPTGYWGIIRDISVRKENEQAMLEWNQTLERRVAERTAELHQSEARFRQLTEATFEGIAISEAGILIDGNPQLASIHGCELSEMIGRPVAEFVAPESRSLVVRRISEGSEAVYECFGMRKDGTKFPAEVRGSMRTWQGRRIRVTALRDLTEAKQAAVRLQAQQTELEQAQRLGLVSEVSAGIIHQVGQPLCSMGANLHAGLARMGTCNGQSCGALEIINDVNADVERLRKIVVHLRALANPWRANRARFDFNAMVSDVLHLLRSEAGTRSMAISTNFSPDLPVVDGDSVQLSQVVQNLVRNAFDSCSELPPERRRIDVATRLVDGGRRVELCVSDTGAGIAPHVMDVLFAPFITTKPEGVGMGLRLSQTIVHAHGGKIEGINNPDGVGATFRVLLSVNYDADYPKV